MLIHRELNVYIVVWQKKANNNKSVETYYILNDSHKSQDN